MALLTAGYVEELQQAMRLGVPLSPHVGSLTDATLAGVLEYGCLRWAAPNGSTVPPLPRPIADGALGKALHEVRSPLGTRAAGRQKADPRSVATREAEFYALEGDPPTLDPAWEDYVIRFYRSSVGAGLSGVLADGLGATLHEMAENVPIHAESPVGALAGFHVTPGVARFSVVDAGRGVLASLSTHPDYAHLRLHVDALWAVLRDRASSFGRGKGGNGFRQLFKSLAAQSGELRFRSVGGCVTITGDDLARTTGVESSPEPLPGFQVSVVCRADGAATSVPLI